MAAARRSLVWLLLVLLALVGLNWFTVAAQDGSWAPKLALDLEGGTQLVLEAQLAEGQANPTAEQMSQAVGIIRQRVDASGVSEAEITTQGGRNIVVAVPGEMDPETRARVESSAKLEFRPVLMATGAEQVQIISPEDLGPDATISTEPTAPPTDPSDLVQATDQLVIDYLAYDCAAEMGTTRPPADPAAPLITCDVDGVEKYLLGPVEIEGTRIADASSGMGTNAQGVQTGQWVVNLEFDATGTEQFREVTQRLYAIGAQVDPTTGMLDQTRSRFAVTMDNLVITAPTANAVITDGRAQISGSFTEASSKALADQLKFGALPFSFETKSSQTISATLGTWQLQAGLIAGAIGLALVVVYSLFQYRALGLVTIASLTLLGVVAYLVVTFLSNQEGYRLSLAGVAGLIVSIGITADSFIVYFERIKDELRDGKTLAAAVEHGWSRAIRTILASDAVNFLVAIVLFIMAVGNVRGFAITLGITTLIDLLVVSLFTHPVMRLLATTRFFGDGHPASGLDPQALGAVYRGRGRFRTTDTGKHDGADREAVRRQSLAERKRAAAADDRGDDPGEAPGDGAAAAAAGTTKKGAE
ncbi:MAG: protein translocase subunit SecD [Microbacteriaceae bacterium]|nr:protein translocase subunit SecD [Microbacteriaceae bacterium]